MDRKKYTLLTAAFALRVLAWGQTIEIERAVLNAALKDGSLSSTEVQARVKALKDVEAIYPKMPYDSVGNDIVANQVITFPGVMKGQAFERAKEWAALHFGSLEAVTDYEYAEGGKLIFEGWTPMVYTATYQNIWGNIKEKSATARLIYSLVLTIKDGKAKVQYKNVKYRVSIPSYIGTTGLYVPAQEFTTAVGFAFPMAKSDPGTWRGTINFFNAVMASMNGTITSIETFLRATSEDNKF